MPLCERTPLTDRFYLYQKSKDSRLFRDTAERILDTAVVELIADLENGMLESTCTCFDGVADEDHEDVECTCEWPNALTQEFTLGAVLADLYSMLNLTLPPELAQAAGLVEAPEPVPAA